MPGTDQAVHAAIEQDDATFELKTLLDKGSSSDGGLYLAGKLGHSECVQLLLDTHAAVDQPDSDGDTPLSSPAIEATATACSCCSPPTPPSTSQATTAARLFSSPATEAKASACSCCLPPTPPSTSQTPTGQITSA